MIPRIVLARGPVRFRRSQYGYIANSHRSSQYIRIWSKTGPIGCDRAGMTSIEQHKDAVPLRQFENYIPKLNDRYCRSFEKRWSSDVNAIGKQIKLIIYDRPMPRKHDYR